MMASACVTKFAFKSSIFVSTETKYVSQIHLAPVVQRVDSAIHRINHYPADKCWENKLDYPLDSDLSGG